MGQTAVPRKDIPRSRPVDGAIGNQVRNKDPNRHYVLANPNDDYCGVSFYLELGYEVELTRKDGPKMFAGRTSQEGSQVTFHGQVLMSCPMDEHLERLQAGWDRAEAIDRQIKAPGGIDQLRGPTGRLAINETTND